jgi:hypothetical protein
MYRGILKWTVYSLASVIAGVLFGFAMLVLWFIVTFIFLRNGVDSAPSWVNVVNDISLYGGIIVGIVMAELLFILYDRKSRKKQTCHDTRS